jgi:hypothetical protein
MQETQLSRIDLVSILSAILLGGTSNHGPGEGDITTAVEASFRILDAVGKKLKPVHQG